MTNDIKLLGQHIQVPIQMPKDFFSVILEKGKEWDTGGDSKQKAAKLEIVGPRRKGWETNFKETNPGKTQAWS